MKFIRIILGCCSLLIVAALTGCGGGSGGGIASQASAPMISGVAATGAPITPAMNGVVTIQDSATPAHTATTPTDANGYYSFTAAQLSGWSKPYMMEINYKVGGVVYLLHSAATASDLTSGSATINITPLTDLVISNLAGTVAANVFKNQSTYASKLTSTALATGATTLKTQIAAVMATEGVSASVDLFRQSFTANGTGLDALLDALKVTQNPVTNTATITNRLNGSTSTSVLGSTTAPTPLTAPATAVPITDLQAITSLFSNFSAEMALAPAPSDPKLLAFFDQTNFKQDGKNLANFLQQITSNPTILGGTISFADITLNPLPTWITTVPTTATASYKVSFTVQLNGIPNSREEFIVYKNSAGNWIALGSQKVAKARMEALETSGFNSMTATRVNCTGLFPQVRDDGALGISFAVVTGPGLPAAGLLLFANGNTQYDFSLAAGDVSTYAGTATTPINTSTCMFNSLYPMNDTTIATIPDGSQYTIKLYKDLAPGTPNAATATLVATYHPILAAAPLTNALINTTPTATTGLFPTAETANPAILGLAQGSVAGTSTIAWTAPTAPNLYASAVNIYVSNAGGVSNQNMIDVAGNVTSTTLTVPLLTGANGASVTISYTDNSFRNYWTSF